MILRLSDGAFLVACWDTFGATTTTDCLTWGGPRCWKAEGGGNEIPRGEDHRDRLGLIMSTEYEIMYMWYMIADYLYTCSSNAMNIITSESRHFRIRGRLVCPIFEIFCSSLVPTTLWTRTGRDQCLRGVCRMIIRSSDQAVYTVRDTSHYSPKV